MSLIALHKRDLKARKKKRMVHYRLLHKRSWGREFVMIFQHKGSHRALIIISKIVEVFPDFALLITSINKKQAEGCCNVQCDNILLA